ncbi:MAG: oxidoreductase, family [Pseudonocardiales bacterium]|nr:oxidoreductase, family [Pseudonocardiales bacterium]
MSGKVVLITGGARGQGRAHAVAFAQAGADVAVCDACAPFDSVQYAPARTQDLDQTRNAVQQLGRRCVTVQADVSQAGQMEQFVAQTVAELGRIDYVVANAGIWSIGGPLWTMSEDRFDETIAVNLKGVWLTVRYTVPHLLKHKSGSIVLTSSVAGTRGTQNIGHYVAAKHGVLGLMKTLAAELAPHNVRVNALLPGLVNTDMIFFPEQYALFSPGEPTRDGYLATLDRMARMPGRWSEPDELARGALWLCSPDAGSVTGLELKIDRGASL